MEFEKELDRLTRFVPLETLSAQVKIAIKYVPEDVTHVLPSINLNPDGLVLARVLLVTENFLCDVRIGHTEFDIVAKNSIVNYRFRLWLHEIKDADVVKASYEGAEIRLLHGPSGDFVTELSYAGNERTAWLDQVIEAIPLKLVLGKQVPI